MTAKGNSAVKVSGVKGDRVYILGDVDDRLCESVIMPLEEKIDELAKLKSAEMPVTINSNGGYVHVALHIVALLERAKAEGIKVKTIVPYKAYSAGSMIAIAGSPGHRYVYQSAEHLIHYGTFPGGWDQTPKQVRRDSKRRERWFKNLVAHYERYARVPKLEKRIEDDNFFIPAHKCVKWGLADHVLGVAQ